MVQDDDTGSHAEFNISGEDRVPESGEPPRQFLPAHISDDIREKGLRDGWRAERIREHVWRTWEYDVSVPTIRQIIKEEPRPPQIDGPGL